MEAIIPVLSRHLSLLATKKLLLTQPPKTLILTSVYLSPLPATLLADGTNHGAQISLGKTITLLFPSNV